MGNLLLLCVMLKSMVLADAPREEEEEENLLSDAEMGESDDPYYWWARTQPKLRAKAMNIEQTHENLVNLAHERENLRAARAALPEVSATTMSLTKLLSS